MLFFLSFKLLASTQLIIENFEETNRDYRYILKTGNQNFSKVILDCQSFFNGIELYKTDSALPQEIFYLYHDECGEIFFFIKDSLDLNEKTCLILDDDFETYELSSDVVNCL